MSIVDTEDIAEMQDKKFEIEELLRKWDTLITKISYMELRLYQLKNEVFKQEQEIINNFDFKAEYGKNNSDVRKAHLRSELGEKYDYMKSMEVKLDECKRRASFIGESVRVKRELLKYG